MQGQIAIKAICRRSPISNPNSSIDPKIGGVAAIAPWFRLRLPSRGPGFESQAHHLRFFQYVLLKLYQENNENKQKKRLGLAHFLQLLDKNTFLLSFPKLCRS